MLNNIALDVVIGLVFIYLLYSLLASILQELIATQLSFRSKMLEKAIIRMLEDGKKSGSLPLLERYKGFGQMLFRTNPLRDKPFTREFYEHPLVKYMSEDNYYSKPSYLSAGNFSRIMIDILTGMAPADMSVIQSTVWEGKALLASNTEKSRVLMLPRDTAYQLQSFLATSKGDLEKFRLSLEKWFDDTMERVTGWYKRYIQFLLFLIGIIIAVAFNVDSIRIAQKLARDSQLREQLVQSAGNYLEKNQQLGIRLAAMKTVNDTGTVFKQQWQSYEELRQHSDSLLSSAQQMINSDIKGIKDVMGLGYECKHPVLLHVFFFAYPDASFPNFIGWILTALAISLGAPFWFDLLNKLMRLRSGNNSKDSGNNPSAPVTVTVNTQTNTGEEAVG